MGIAEVRDRLDRSLILAAMDAYDASPDPGEFVRQVEGLPSQTFWISERGNTYPLKAICAHAVKESPSVAQAGTFATALRELEFQVVDQNGAPR